ncbi:hypothetical protein [Spirillospora sp. CA-128828]|uniref:hypothetical protein n=1 Tax=Spirillospora sp. CA-128828 TaxID=3240033 RepID=UPI003D8D04DC
MTASMAPARPEFSVETPPPGVSSEMMARAIARGMQLWELHHLVQVRFNDEFRTCSVFDYVKGFLDIRATTEEIREAKSLGVFPGDYGSARVHATHAQVKEIVETCGADEVSWYGLALQYASHDQVMQAAGQGVYPSLFGPELRDGKSPADALQYFAGLWSDED